MTTTTSFNYTQENIDLTQLVEQLRHYMQQIKAKPTVSHAKQAVFVHKVLKTCSYVFVRRDSVRRSLQAPYEGPFLVLKRTDKLFIVNVKGKVSTISIDRVKPAFMPNTDSDTTPNATKLSLDKPQRQSFVKLVAAIIFTSLIISYHHDDTGGEDYHEPGVERDTGSVAPLRKRGSPMILPPGSEPSRQRN
ncbi:transposon Tf2-6 polyprotein [Nephila pilipes]|uniref:Transposon Tf2-6 polyprotein n=1 Tax=Nephila pilipes TaxID=299642 RepID=A0A8X6NQQ6_NEPPI|nr:transposon Tf2-6 polyprotein [Nephila pilipes]